jgi:hypothetical protein
MTKRVSRSLQLHWYVCVLSDPMVLQDLLDGQPFGRVFDQQLCHQVFGTRREIWRECVVKCCYVAVSGTLALRLERWFAHQELIAQYTQTPYISTGTVAALFNHLRRKVIQSSAHSLSPPPWRVDTPPEIGNLELTPMVEKEVLRFDVTVDDVLLVKVVKGVGKLTNELGCEWFWEFPHSRQVSIEFTFLCKLQDKIDPLGVMEVGVHSQNILMPDVGLYLNLTLELVLDIVIHQFLLLQHFQGTYEFGSLLPCQVNGPVLAVAQESTNIKIIQAEAVEWTFGNAFLVLLLCVLDVTVLSVGWAPNVFFVHRRTFGEVKLHLLGVVVVVVNGIVGSAELKVGEVLQNAL